MRKHLHLCLLAAAIVALSGPRLQAQFTQLEDQYPGTGSSDIERINRASMNNWLYFNIFDVNFVPRIYRTAGSVPAQPINNNLTGYNIGPMGGLFYFMGDDGVTGREPWVTDGTTAGTRKLVDIVNGPAGINDLEMGPVINGYGYFFAFSIDSRGNITFYLYKTNGTTAGTTKLKTWKSILVSATRIRDVGGKGVFLQGYTGSTQGIWVTNGTAKSTVSIKTVTIFPIADPVVLNNKYYCRANDGSGMELWVSDGTSAGTYEIADLNPGSAASMPDYLTVLNGKIYFSATTPATGTELYVYEPGVGISLAADIVSGTGSSSPKWLTVMGSKLYFNATTPDNGRELWVYEPGVGASMVKDIQTGTAGGDPRYGNGAREDYDLHFAVLGEYLYFAANDGTGFKLWRSNGTALGTEMVPGFDALGLIWPNSLEVVGSKLYFLAYTNSTVGNCLWVYTPPSPKSPAQIGPSEFASMAAYPNPFRGSTILEYTLSSDMNVRLVVTDLLGREVAVLVDGLRSVGSHSARFDAATLAPGSYVARLQSGTTMVTRMLQILR